MLNRRLLTLAVPLAAGALALTACGSGNGGGNNASGGSSSGTGGGSQTYTIAYQGPLSGGNAQLGLNMAFAVKLAVQQANDGTTFGKLPFTLQFQQQDDQGSATAAPAAVAKVLQIKDLAAVVGPAFSGATRASEPTYSQAGVPTVSPSATAPDLAESGWKNFFRVVADDNAQGPADALYLGKVSKTPKVYAVDDASAYAAGLMKAFQGAASSNGVTVVKEETAPGTTQCQAGNGNVQQYGPLSTKIVSSGAQAVFYAGYYCDFALLSKQLAAAGFKGTLMSDDGSNDSQYVKQAGSAAEGALLSCACQEEIAGGKYTQFADEFQKLANFKPGTYSAESYDAANSIIKVMKEKGAGVTKQDIIDGLHAPGFSYDGISKTVEFANNGNYGGSAVYMYQVKNGKITQLGLISDLAKG